MVTKITGFKQLANQIAKSRGKVNILGEFAELSDGTALGKRIGKIAPNGNMAFRFEDGERTIISGVNKNNKLISVNYITESPSCFSRRSEQKMFNKLNFNVSPEGMLDGKDIILTQGSREIFGSNYASFREEKGYVRNIIPRIIKPFKPDLELLPNSYRSRGYKATRDTQFNKYTSFEMYDRNIATNLNTFTFKKLI